MTTDDGGHRRAAVDANAKADGPSVLLVQPSDPVEHVERHIGDGLRVVGPGHWQPAHDKIGVTRGANGPQAMLLSQLIEGAQELIENGDRDIRGLSGGTLREADHVGEKHADVIEPIGDRVLLAFEPLGDLGWKYVEEQPLGSLQGLIPLNPEVGQDEGDDTGHAAEVEDEKRRLSTVGQRRNRSSQRWVNQGGQSSHGDEPGQPRPSGPRPEENQSTEGSKK